MNTIKNLMDFFGCPDRPVTPAEFRNFWMSCSKSEQEYYKNAPLS